MPRFFCTVATLTLALASTQVSAQTDRYGDQEYRPSAAPAYDSNRAAGGYDRGDAAPLRQPEPAAAAPTRAFNLPFQRAASRVVDNQTDSGVVRAHAIEAVESSPQPLPAARQEKSLPLAPLTSDGEPRKARSTSSLTAVLGSLAIVCGLFCVLAWVMRKGMPKGLNLLPRGAVEVLGRMPIAARQQVYLVRCGGKMLLLSVTAAGIEALTEITDPVEVDRLAGICQQAHPLSSTKSFHKVFEQFDMEPAPAGFTGEKIRTQRDIAINPSPRGGSYG